MTPKRVPAKSKTLNLAKPVDVVKEIESPDPKSSHLLLPKNNGNKLDRS